MALGLRKDKVATYGRMAAFTDLSIEPPPTSLSGDEVHDRITSGLSDCEESVRRKIPWDNARKLYKVEGPTAPDEARRTAAVGA